MTQIFEIIQNDKYYIKNNILDGELSNINLEDFCKKILIPDKLSEKIKNTLENKGYDIKTILYFLQNNFESLKDTFRDHLEYLNLLDILYSYYQIYKNNNILNQYNNLNIYEQTHEFIINIKKKYIPPTNTFNHSNLKKDKILNQNYINLITNIINMLTYEHKQQLKGLQFELLRCGDLIMKKEEQLIRLKADDSESMYR